MNYSVIMAVYINDKADWLTQAVESILGQTVPSNDIIIVVDGPVSKEVNDVINLYERNSIINIIRLKENRGLGYALNLGIKNSKNELIGRMDSDDISFPNRFEIQLNKFKNDSNLEILGGQIVEFLNETSEAVSYRMVPVLHEDIVKFSRRRNPFNHPTIMYKKSMVLKVGCYDPEAVRVEDYDLWLRAIAQGAHCANVEFTVLGYRIDNNTIKRRKSFVSFVSHIRARRRFYLNNYIGLTDFFYGVMSQAILFIMPTRLAGLTFKKVLRDD